MHLIKSSAWHLAALAAVLPVFASAALTTTQTGTSTASFFLPSRSTSSGYHIYATPITSDASTTQYLLACQTQFGVSSYSCGGEFTGLTLTYGPSSMHLNLGPSVGLEYNCALLPAAVCTVTSSGIVATSTVVSLAATETSKSITPVTILVNDVKTISSTTSPTNAAATTTSGSGGSGVCKRKVGSGSGATTAGGADTTAGDAAATTTGDCSDGGRVGFGLLMFGVTALAILVGVVVL